MKITHSVITTLHAGKQRVTISISRNAVTWTWYYNKKEKHQYVMCHDMVLECFEEWHNQKEIEKSAKKLRKV